MPAVPDMSFLAWIVGGGFFIAFVIVAVAVIRMMIAMKRAGVPFKDLGKTLNAVHEMEKQQQAKTRKDQNGKTAASKDKRR